MIGAILHAFWSHWRQNRLQLATLVTGIALATALWTGVQAINAEARASMDSAADAGRIAALPRLERAGGAPIGMAEFVALRRAGILVSPLIRGEIEPMPGLRPTLTGIDPLTAPEDLWPPGDFMAATAPANEVFYNAPGPQPPGFLPMAALPEGQAVADIETAQRQLGRDGFDALLLVPPQPLGAPDPLSVIPDLQYVLPAATTAPEALTESFQMNLSAFGALCFIVGLFIVRGTVGLASADAAWLSCARLAHRRKAWAL